MLLERSDRRKGVPPNLLELAVYERSDNSRSFLIEPIVSTVDFPYNIHCQSQINIKSLHYFVAIALHGSLRKASVILGVQESSVSRRIRDLESQLGASLF